MDWEDIKIKLGDKCRDTVTGLVGTIVAKAEYKNGCRNFELQPPAKNGVVPPSQWPDVQDVEAVKTTRKVKAATKPKWIGGPRPRPAGRSTPPSMTR